MNECTTCGREYTSALEALHCSDFDNSDLDDRLVSTIQRGLD